MLLTLALLFLLIVLGFIFLTLFRASLRSRKLWVKILGGAVSILGTFLAVVIVGLTFAGIAEVERSRASAAADIPVEITPERVARGEQLAWLCVDCHSSTGQLPLNGSRTNLMPENPPVGAVYGTNLTPGGPLARWSDGEIIRAIREGLDDKGRPLVAMPSIAFHGMSDEDVQALVAYLRSQPALRHDQPPPSSTLIGYLLLATGLAPTSAQPPVSEPVVAPPRGVSPEYGEYLIGIAGCYDCHGWDLDGVPINQFVPPGPDLRLRASGWTPEQFIALFRSGALPEGRTASPVMPWRTTGYAMTDDDLRAMHAYVSALPD